MKHLIWTLSNDDCIQYVSELSIYFEFFNFHLVDKEGNTVIDLKQNYYYKSGRNTFPIINNKSWFGDYFDFNGNLVLTQAQKIALIKNVPVNARLFNAVDNTDQFVINQLLNIAADYALDYYRANRSYEQDKSYGLTKDNFNKSFSHRFSQLDQHTQEEIIIELGTKVAKIAPKLLDLISEYAAIYDLSYNLLSFYVTAGILYVYTDGDWRIQQWEQDKNNKAQIDKDILVDNIKSINDAIEAEHKNVLFRERLSQMRRMRN